MNQYSTIKKKGENFVLQLYQTMERSSKKWNWVQINQKN